MKQLFTTPEAGGPCVLVASCLGESTGGGLVAFDGETIQVIDTISCTGITIAGGRFMRLLWCKGDFLSPGELLIYDATGVERYYRIDALNDPHDIVFDGENYVIVSAGSNSILWIGPAGQVLRKSTMPGEPDSWHINGLCMRDGELFVSAFGRFDRHREWMEHCGEPCGVLFHHESGKDVVTGLDRPHHPRATENNSWIVCNSGMRELVEIDARTGDLLRRAQMEKWTRGLALSERYIFVGESARRHRPQGDSGDALGSVAILDRATWKVVERIALPFEEVYDLLLAPVDLVEGLRRGFKTNPQRVLEQNQHALFAEVGAKPVHLWAIGELLPVDSCVVTMSAQVETILKPDTIFECPCELANRGSCILVGAWPNPVVISYRWVSRSGEQFQADASFETILPHAVPPGSSVACNFRFRTPPTEGLYELQVSPYQKGRGFFADLDSANAFKTEILISGDGPTPPAVRTETAAPEPM